MFGTPPVRALFFEFPDEPELFDVSTQFLIGRDVLVTPVLIPNATTVNGASGVPQVRRILIKQPLNKGIFPGRANVIWRDWYTHDIVDYESGAATTLTAPLGHINVHVRDRSAILLHASPAYTIEETRQGPFSLLISQSVDGYAFGSAYIDDGVTYPPTPSKTLTFSVTRSQVVIATHGSFNVTQRLRDITILGVSAEPSFVFVDGKEITKWYYVASKCKLVAQSLNIDLNIRVKVYWE